MVPAVNKNGVITQVPNLKNAGEPEEGLETPEWMKDDGREMVNTIEMAIRGVNTK